MDLNSLPDLKRLEEQIFYYKPNIKSTKKKKCVSEQLRNQLLQSKAVVQIQRLDEECESLMISLKQRLIFLQDVIIPKKKLNFQKKQETKKIDEFKLNLSSESSDDETMSTLLSEHTEKDKVETKITELADTSEQTSSDLPLSLCRKSRERILSYKSCSSASTSRSKTKHRKPRKQEHTGEVLIEEDEGGTTPTLHIKIPSLHRGNVHHIVLDSLKFARKVLDYRANEVKKQELKRITPHESRTSIPHKRKLKCTDSPVLQQLTEQKHDLELSQFIQDVMTEACNDETLQATKALETINNNLIDNYDLVENDIFINYSQSSQEFLYSQNSNLIVDSVCNTSDGSTVRKKPRKYIKRSNEQRQNEPRKKRGRKPGKKTNSDSLKLQTQSPTKSNLAQYVELFSNDCDLLPGSTTPAASSTRSQPLVSSTTQSFELFDQYPQQQEKQDSLQQRITCYIDGDWANGGPCHLVTANSMSFDDKQLNEDDHASVRNFVNYIGNSGDSRNNIATVLECNNSLSISDPQSIGNFVLHNNNCHETTRQNHHHSTVQNTLLPIINIQIPPLPNNNSSSEPPPAHMHKEVIDLSIKSKTNANIIPKETFNLLQISSNKLATPHNFHSEDDECLPLDLSANGFTKEKNSVTIDTQDEDFIRRLIEQNDFDYKAEELRKGTENASLVYDNENKSFRAALDMPILDFYDTDLAKLVENTANTSSQSQNITTDIIGDNVSKNNENLNFVSMSTINSTMENSLNFSDQSTTELFNKLLEIGPDNHFLSGDDLNQGIFDQHSVERSAMAVIENPRTSKSTLEEGEEDIYNVTSEDNQEIENTSNDKSSSCTSLVVHLDREYGAEDTSSDGNNSIEQRSVELTQKTNIKSSALLEINSEICNKPQQFTTILENENSKTIVRPNEDKSLNNTFSKNVKESINLKPPVEANENILDNKCLSYSSKVHKPNNDGSTEPSTEYSNVPSKENVVFSVAKITLSEDDNMYNTDSDVSKSCDLSEFKTTSVYFKDINESDEDLNLSDNEVENPQKIEKNIDHELVNISEKKIYCIEEKNDNRSDSKCSNIADEKLSLLELESKLENLTDFGEDLDDALSLATSCFESPNDDRFEDSIVDINTETTTTILQDLQQPEICPNAPQIKGLNYFKIPKLNDSTDSIMVLNKPEANNFSNSPPNGSAIITPNIENITVVNDLNKLNTDVGMMSEAKPEEIEEPISINILKKVFGITCLPFLVDGCSALTDCQLSHQLNDAEKMNRNLKSLRKSHANLAYHIMYNNMKLYKEYFKKFCAYYTNKNDRKKLLNMVNDCERYPDCAEFIIAIYEGLMQCGLSRINACRLILKCIREKSIPTSILEVLVTIIMESDWTMFTDFIEKYTQDIYQYNFRICILEKMAPAVLNSKGPHLKQVFGKCVQTLRRYDMGLLLNSPILVQCVSLLTAAETIKKQIPKQ